MVPFLISQTLLVSRGEAEELGRQIIHYLVQPVDEHHKLHLFEVLAYPYLRSIANRLSRRISHAKGGKPIRITFSIQELVAIYELVDCTQSTMGVFHQIDQRLRNYDSKIIF